VCDISYTTRTVTVYESPKQSITLNEDDTLEGGAVLPGFTLKLRDLFARVEAS
jgi:hypothetical protein